MDYCKSLATMKKSIAKICNKNQTMKMEYYEEKKRLLSCYKHLYILEMQLF